MTQPTPKPEVEGALRDACESLIRRTLPHEESCGWQEPDYITNKVKCICQHEDRVRRRAVRAISAFKPLLAAAESRGRREGAREASE